MVQCYGIGGSLEKLDSRRWKVDSWGILSDMVPHPSRTGPRREPVPSAGTGFEVFGLAGEEVVCSRRDIFGDQPSNTMKVYLYYSLIPEALIFSMLPPEKFGMYLAIGSKRQTEGPALFFEVDPEADLSAFKIEETRSRCVEHPDGAPKNSTYVAVYHVLANLPLPALRSLYLTTQAGFTLELKSQPYVAPSDPQPLHLYQELGPVYPRVASNLDPEEFCRYVTDPSQPIYLPKVVFCELKINGLARDPMGHQAGDLPYRRLGHLRECLAGIQAKPEKRTKIVEREMRPDILYYMIQNGIYAGDQEHFLFYPMPTEDELASKHYLWWHSARRLRSY